MTDTFRYRRIEGADALSALNADSVAYAGGTDLIPRLHAGITECTSVVDIKDAGLSDRISIETNSVSLGPLATLAALAQHPELDGRASALRQAAGQAATRQIRNRATIAGNLLQRPRCPYFRLSHVDCWLKGGETCPARDGVNTHHAIFGTKGPCVAVHPSDPANALVAFDTEIEIQSNSGSRSVPLAHILTAPTDTDRSENTLTADELITGLSFEMPKRSVYMKAMDRATWAFALSSVAIAEMADSSFRVVSGGVANVPYRLRAVEDQLAADPNGLDAARIRGVLEAEAEPLSNNAYKVALLGGLISEAVERLRDVA